MCSFLGYYSVKPKERKILLAVSSIHSFIHVLKHILGATEIRFNVHFIVLRRKAILILLVARM